MKGRTGVVVCAYVRRSGLRSISLLKAGLLQDIVACDGLEGQKLPSGHGVHNIVRKLRLVADAAAPEAEALVSQRVAKVLHAEVDLLLRRWHRDPASTCFVVCCVYVVAAPGQVRRGCAGHCSVMLLPSDLSPAPNTSLQTSGIMGVPLYAALIHRLLRRAGQRAKPRCNGLPLPPVPCPDGVVRLASTIAVNTHDRYALHVAVAAVVRDDIAHSIPVVQRRGSGGCGRGDGWVLQWCGRALRVTAPTPASLVLVRLPLRSASALRWSIACEAPCISTTECARCTEPKRRLCCPD